LVDCGSECGLNIIAQRVPRLLVTEGMPREFYDRIWLVSFMHYDLGYFDLEQRTLQLLDNPFGTRLSPMS
jgi:hypothetical protein